jgi:vitamin B12 transporter
MTLMRLRSWSRAGVRATFLGAVGLVSAAQAQQGGPAVDRTRDTARLGTMTVTASRTPTPLAATGASLTVFTAAELRAKGITRVVDVLREVPSASVVQQSANGSLTSLFLRGGESRFVKVLIDGVPVNEAGGQFDFGQLTTDNVERIEVLRGPASIEWGSDAVAGVVHVITRQGDRRTRLATSIRAGTTGAPTSANVPSPTVGTRDADVELSGPVGDWRWSIGGAAHRAVGLSPFNNRWRNDTWSASLRTAPGSRNDVRFTVRGTDANYQTPTNSAGAFTDSNAFRLERRLVAGVELGRQLTSRVEGRLTLSANELRGINSNQPDSPGDTLGFTSRNVATVFRRVADARLVTTLPASTRLTTGLELQRLGELNVGESQFQRFAPTRDRFDRRRSNTAAYASLLALPNERLTVNLGARYDDNSVFGTFFTMRHGVSYEVVSNTRLRALYGTAYREPNFNEQFNTSFTVGNPTLSPERTRTWEVGASHELPGLVRVGATWFDQRFTNLIQYRFSSIPTDPNYFNLASATARGLELEWGIDPSAVGIIFSGNWTYLDTEVRDAGTGAGGALVAGQRLLRRPQAQASVTLGRVLGRVGTVQVTAQHVGQRADLNFNTFPAARVALGAYRRYDAAWELPPNARTGRPGLTLRIENLTNASYQHVFGFAQPGRVVLLGVRGGWTLN